MTGLGLQLGLKPPALSRPRAPITLPPLALALVSPADSSSASYLLEFAVFDTSPPTSVQVRVDEGEWLDLLAPPPAPGLSATPGNFSVTLEAAGDGPTFQFFRGDTLIYDGDEATYADTGLEAGAEYSYTATQTDENGNVSPESEAETATPLAAPQLPQANLVADYRFTETTGALIDQKSGYDSTTLTNVTRNGLFYRSAADGTSRLALETALETVLNGKSGGYLGALIRFASVPGAVSQIASISAALGLGLSVNPRLRAGVRAGGSTTLSTPAINLAVNTWHYLAVDFNGTNFVAILEETTNPPVAKTGTLSLAGDPFIFTTETQASPASSLDIALLHVYDASKRADLADIYDFVESVRAERDL